MSPDGGEQSEHSLRPPPQQIHQPTPQHARKSVFSLTPISSSSSSHPSSPGSPEIEPEHSPESASGPPPSARNLAPLDATATLGSSLTTSMSNSSERSSGRATPPPTKSRSILNLTSSTLLGIYSPTGYDANRYEPETPWGSGAQTPALRNGEPLPSNLAERLQEKTQGQLRDPPAALSPSQPGVTRLRSDSGAEVQKRGKASWKKQRSWPQYIANVTWRAVALFVLGMAYSSVVTHLHDTRKIAPVEVDINRSSWFYLCSWGAGSVLLGFLQPWVDKQWDHGGFGDHENPPRDEDALNKGGVRPKGDISRLQPDEPPDEESGAEWNPIVRSVGAFVGIAFAIRRLPWQSTLQVSLTLALANPVIWYLIDRTPPGFALALLNGLAGATVLMGVNPGIVPAPAPLPASSTGVGADGILGVSLESIGVATWLGSVFFCACVCFGNVGRRLARRLV